MLNRKERKALAAIGVENGKRRLLVRRLTAARTQDGKVQVPEKYRFDLIDTTPLSTASLRQCMLPVAQTIPDCHTQAPASCCVSPNRTR